MTLTYLITASAPQEPFRPRLSELLALLPAGDPKRHGRMIEAAQRLYPLEYRPPLERQSRFRSQFAAA